MTVFVDTPALYAILDRDDANHEKAAGACIALLQESARLFTNNYVLLELCALAQRRLGIAAVRMFQEDILPLIEVDWIAEQDDHSGVAAVLTSGPQ